MVRWRKLIIFALFLLQCLFSRGFVAPCNRNLGNSLTHFACQVLSLIKHSHHVLPPLYSPYLHDNLCCAVIPYSLESSPVYSHIIARRTSKCKSWRCYFLLKISMATLAWTEISLTVLKTLQTITIRFECSHPTDLCSLPVLCAILTPTWASQTHLLPRFFLHHPIPVLGFMTSGISFLAVQICLWNIYFVEV